MKRTKEITIGAKLEKGIDFIGEVLAFFTVGLWVFMFLQYTFSFIPADAMAGSWTVVGMLEYIKTWATLLILGLKGLEFALKRGFMTFLIYIALVAACVIFMFLPSVWENLFGAVAA